MTRSRILIVEDDQDLRALYRMTLLLHGYEVAEANTGYAALQQLEIRAPDLIILDLMLPGYDGLAVLRDISAHPSLHHLPVIVVTGAARPIDHLPVARALRKPLTAAQLLDAVAECLDTRGRRG